MDRHIETFLTAKHIAVVGVSDRKFGGAIYRSLKKRGYRVYPVHPAKDTFDGDPCYPNLGAIPAEIHGAVLAVSPANAEQVVDDAREAGVENLWFQQGADFTGAIKKAEALGMQPVGGKCILMYAAPVTGIHAVHRFLARLFGKL